MDQIESIKVVKRTFIDFEQEVKWLDIEGN